MRKRCSFLVAPVLAACCLAAATVPSSQPSPKLALASLFRSILSADENATFDLLVFANADARQSARTMLHQLIATARLRRAVITAFGPKGQDTSVGRKEDQDTQNLLNLLGPAPVKIDGTAATITLSNGQAFDLTLTAGTWKVEYDKSQQRMGGLPSKEDLQEAATRSAAIERLTSEVVSRKYSTLEDVEARFNGIMLPSASTKPMVRP